MKRALIAGITGQDGSYLAQFLLDRGYAVFGIVRTNRFRINDHRLRSLGVADKIQVCEGDIGDLSSLLRIIKEVEPDEIYNLAAQSSVISSWQQSILTGTITGLGAANMLEATRTMRPNARYYQGSSSEMFGRVQRPVQSEMTPFYPRSPIGVAKVYAHWMTVNYRESFGLHASNGILFNHESPLRGTEYITRKVTDGAARIKLGLAAELRLGRIDNKRDWGHARDYARAMWLMLQQDTPDDYVIATGRTTSIRGMCEIAFGHVGLKASDYIVIDSALTRLADVDAVCGDAAKARSRLGWEPTISLEALIVEMVEADMARLKTDRAS